MIFNSNLEVIVVRFMVFGFGDKDFLFKFDVNETLKNDMNLFSDINGKP